MIENQQLIIVLTVNSAPSGCQQKSGSVLRLPRSGLYCGCGGQDTPSYAVVTNNPQISGVSNIKGLFLNHTACCSFFGEGSTPYCPNTEPMLTEPFSGTLPVTGGKRKGM